jgi:hypothetical protein
MTTKLAIDKDAPLAPGDVIELKFKWLTSWLWLRAAQFALIESRLNRKYDEFEVLRYEMFDDGFIVQVKVKGQ